MAIELRDTRSSGHVALINCDHCGGRVVDAADAIVIWPLSEAEKPRTQSFYITHRLECDSALKEQLGEATLWMPLPEFLESLSESVKP